MDEGKLYFSRKQGNPQMPGFGAEPRTPAMADAGVPRHRDPRACSSAEQVWAIVTYERNLSNDSTVKSPVAGTADSPTFAGAHR